MGTFQNFAGTRFGRWIVVDRARIGDKRTKWNCLCDCGSKAVIPVDNLKSGRSTSCGCFRKEFIAQMKRTHGHSINRKPSKTYFTWSRMMMRCYNTKQRDYRWYGAKGVSVCDKWQKFEGFLDDMGVIPDGLTLDRIDPFGNYEKENCRYATWEVQYHNRRKDHESRA